MSDNEKGIGASIAIAILVIFAYFASGCASFGQPDNLLSKGCDKTYEGDIIVLTCETQEIVTRHCAKGAKRSDTGFLWDKSGHGPKGEYIAACAEWFPNAKEYKFRIWLWKDEAWRRSHEEGCHVSLWRRHGALANHAQCAPYGVGKPLKRLPK